MNEPTLYDLLHILDDLNGFGLEITDPDNVRRTLARWGIPRYVQASPMSTPEEYEADLDGICFEHA